MTTNFYNYFVIGQIISGLLWTYLLKFMSQKTCILLCLISQGFVYLMQFWKSSIEMVYFARLLMGFFDNINSVGKSFIYEFADRDYSDFCFTFKGFAALIISNIFPLIGNWVYDFYDKDYANCCLFWFWFNLTIGAVFYVFFYILPISDNTEGNYAKKQKLLEKKETDEVKAQEAEHKHHGLWCVIKYIFSQNQTRNLFIVYMTSKALHKAAYTYKSIIFLKEKDLGGVGFKKEELGAW